MALASLLASVLHARNSFRQSCEDQSEIGGAPRGINDTGKPGLASGTKMEAGRAARLTDAESASGRAPN